MVFWHSRQDSNPDLHRWKRGILTIGPRELNKNDIIKFYFNNILGSPEGIEPPSALKKESGSTIELQWIIVPPAGIEPAINA